MSSPRSTPGASSSGISIRFDSTSQRTVVQPIIGSHSINIFDEENDGFAFLDDTDENASLLPHNSHPTRSELVNNNNLSNDDDDDGDFVLVDDQNENASLSSDTNPSQSDNDNDGFEILNDSADGGSLPAGSQQPPTTIVWTLNKVQRAAISAKNSTLYVAKGVVQHPVAALIGFIAAFPNALNGLVLPTHESPSVISLTWWNSLPQAIKAYAATNAGANFSVNVFCNFVFSLKSYENLGKELKKAFNSPGHFMLNFGSFLLGLSAATATAMISYNAFMWLPGAQYSALVPATFALINAFASRYTGVMNTRGRIAKKYSGITDVQEQFVELLQHIDSNKLDVLRLEFNIALENVRLTGDNELDEKQVSLITKDFANRLDVLFNEADVNKRLEAQPTTGCERAQKAAALIFDIALALTIAGASGAAHAQKGFEGFNVIAKLAKSNSLESLGLWAKRGIGIVPSIAPAMLYGISALDIRITVFNLAKQCYLDPTSIPYATFTLVANCLSSSSMQSVAENIMKNKANILGFNSEENSDLSIAFVTALATGGLITNLKPMAARTPTPKTVTYDRFVLLLDSKKVQIDEDTSKHLKTLSIFKNRYAPAAAPSVDQEIPPVTDGSSFGQLPTQN